MSRNTQRTTYQTDCPTCWNVSELRDKAGPLQAYIKRDLGRSYAANGSPDGLTQRQQGAMTWSTSMADCLRREMDRHARCAACSILMGPGHIEEGTGGFCITHSADAAPAPVPFVDSDADSLDWVADQASH